MFLPSMTLRQKPSQRSQWTVPKILAILSLKSPVELASFGTEISRPATFTPHYDAMLGKGQHN